MKKLVSLVCVLTFASSAFGDGQTTNTGNNQNNNQNNQRASRAEKCIDELKNDIKVRKDIKTAVDKKEVVEADDLERIKSTRDFSDCESLQITSWANKENMMDQDSKPTMDNKATCDLRAGYTLDFPDCKTVRDMYNAVMFAEQAMFKTQQVRQDIQNKEAQKNVAAASANGNLQEAAYNATIEKNKQLAALNREQAATYSVAVATLAGGIGAWKSKGENSMSKLCKKEITNIKKYVIDSKMEIDVDEAKCTKALTRSAGTQRSMVFANDTAKGFFIRATGEFLLKAAEARRRAGLTDDAAKKMAAAMPQDQLVNDVLLEKCAMYPNMPECRPKGPTSPTSGFQGTQFSMDGGGANAFDFNNPGATDPIADEEKKKEEEQTLGSTSSPFEAEAKAANEILNPSSAASIAAGSNNPAGGGGGGGIGGGGGGGGSSASGEEEEPSGEAEIKANKFAGSYGGGGSKGFEAVKNAKEDANPYSSLFEGKGEKDAIEEDRSIASESGSLGLFDKISKGYQKAYESKQIEALNLE